MPTRPVVSSLAPMATYRCIRDFEGAIEAKGYEMFRHYGRATCAIHQPCRGGGGGCPSKWSKIATRVQVKHTDVGGASINISKAGSTLGHKTTSYRESPSTSLVLALKSAIAHRRAAQRHSQRLPALSRLHSASRCQTLDVAVRRLIWDIAEHRRDEPTNCTRTLHGPGAVSPSEMLNSPPVRGHRNSAWCLQQTPVGGLQT